MAPSEGAVATPQAPAFDDEGLIHLAHQVTRPVHIVARRSDGLLGLAADRMWDGDSDHMLVGTLPAMYPEWLGDRTFTEDHGVRFPYVAGEMANGIATTAMVAAMARAEMLGFFGAAGLSLARLERALDQLRADLPERRNWGVNLIHMPNDPELEEQVADRLLRAGVPRISASAFMDLTPAVVRCSAAGLRADATGRITRPRAMFAKVSRPEVAEKFMSPAPGELLRLLTERGQLSEHEAALASRVPVAEDITVEADSGGHTDGRPLVALLPTIMALRQDLQRRLRLARPVRVGAAGGLGDPAGVAAAFGLGAAYVLTGSVNQMSVEAGVSVAAKSLLAKAGIADVAMAPSADMFELGAKVQVLRRGTMFASRAARLDRAYREHASLEAIAPELREALEREVLGCSIDDVWTKTCDFWSERDPAELTRAAEDARHRMALTFRWYLGESTRWAMDGDESRQADYQLWCSSAAGAFNRWTADSFLADPGSRTVTQIALNLLQGAAVLTRVHQLRTHGVAMSSAAFAYRPRMLSCAP